MGKESIAARVEIERGDLLDPPNAVAHRIDMYEELIPCSPEVSICAKERGERFEQRSSLRDVVRGQLTEHVIGEGPEVVLWDVQQQSMDAEAFVRGDLADR